MCAKENRQARAASLREHCRLLLKTKASAWKKLGQSSTAADKPSPTCLWWDDVEVDSEDGSSLSFTTISSQTRQT